MPIRAEMKHHYTRQWDLKALAFKEAAGWRCQWCGDGRGKPIEMEDGRYYRVVITVAHLDQDPSNWKPDNVAVLCAPCHLRFDAPWHGKHAAITRARHLEERAHALGQLHLAI